MTNIDATIKQVQENQITQEFNSELYARHRLSADACHILVDVLKSSPKFKDDEFLHQFSSLEVVNKPIIDRLLSYTPELIVLSACAPAMSISDLMIITTYANNLIHLLYLDKPKVLEDGSMVLTNFFSFVEKTLSSLESINLSGTNIVTQSVVTILEDAPRLKKMILSDCKSLYPGLFEKLGKNTLPNLEEIDLSSTRVIAKDIIAILKAAPNLKWINLHDCKNLEQENLLIPGEENRLSLPVIDFSRSGPGIAEIIKTLKSLPAQKQVPTQEVRKFATGEFEDFENKTFADQHSLKAGSTDIDISSVISISKAFPNLKFLDISNCAQINPKEFTRLPAGSFPSLQVLVAFDIDIRNKDVEAILQAAPNLRKIDIAFNSRLKKGLFDHIDEQYLSKLEAIRIRETNLDISDLLTLIRKAPNLKSVDIADCKISNSQNITLLEKNSLAQLEGLVFGPVSSDCAKAIFEAASNLKTVHHDIPNLKTEHEQYVRHNLPSFDFGSEFVNIN